jgi:hypothetical protein
MEKKSNHSLVEQDVGLYYASSPASAEFGDIERLDSPEWNADIPGQKSKRLAVNDRISFHFQNNVFHSNSTVLINQVL